MKQSHRQAGFSLVSAVFIVVIIALLAGYLVNLGNVQRSTAILGLQGLRATAAAHSGLEWAIARVLADNACMATTRFDLAGRGLNDFDVRVACSSQGVTEGALSYQVFRLSVTASHGIQGSEDFVQRQQVASVSNAP